MEQHSISSCVPVLALVQASVLRTNPRLASLPHVADLIATYLDVSVRFTPPEAATHDSAWLLDLVLTRVMNDLKVDPAVRGHWLARAMEVAIHKNSLATVQQIHSAHPGPLYVRSLQLALQCGTLEMVQWIVDNRHDRLCCAPGVQNLCPVCLNAAVPTSIAEHSAEAIVKWLIYRGADVSRLHGLRRNLKIAQYLDEQGKLEPGNLNTALISSGPPAVETLSYLIERGHTADDEKLLGALARGCYQPELEPVIDVVVASRLCDSFRDKFVWAPTRGGGPKVLQWDADFLAATRIYGTIPMAHNVAFYAAHFCHVDAMKWLWHERGVAPVEVPIRKPMTEEDLLALYKWMKASDVDGWRGEDAACAARKGYLSVIQWLHEHKPDQLTDRTMETAAGEGHTEIVRWLHANRSDGCGAEALNFAARSGHLEMVQWLSANYSTEGDTNQAMVRAATADHLEVVVWLNRTRDDACGACVLRYLLRFGDVPGLNVTRWLTSNATRSATCVGHCVLEPQQHDRRHPSVPALALYSGDITVASFLLQNHRTSFSVEPMEMIVQGGHVSAIQWLHAAATETVNWHLVLEAARQSENEQIAAWVESVLDD